MWWKPSKIYSGVFCCMLGLHTFDSCAPQSLDGSKEIWQSKLQYTDSEHVQRLEKKIRNVFLGTSVTRLARALLVQKLDIQICGPPGQNWSFFAKRIPHVVYDLTPKIPSMSQRNPVNIPLVSSNIPWISHEHPSNIESSLNIWKIQSSQKRAKETPINLQHIPLISHWILIPIKHGANPNQ